MSTANAAIESSPHPGAVASWPDQARLLTSPPVILLAPGGPADAAAVREIASAIADELHAAMPSARVLQAPVIGDSESFTSAILRILRGTIEHVTTSGPHGGQIRVSLGLAGPPGRRTGVFEIDEAVDLRHLPPDRRDPTSASSRGVGRLISAALDRGVSRLIIGCGDSGANDGGIGMATALGVRFLDSRGMEIVEAGGLQRLASIDLSRRDPRLDQISIEAVVNPEDDLIGEHGVTRVYGPRKGASPAQVQRLERGLATFASVIQDQLGIDVTALRGGGASGGLGAGLVAFAGATLIPRHAFERQALGLDASLAEADVLVATGESPAWLVRRAADLGVAVVMLEPGARTIAQVPAGAASAIQSVLSAIGWQALRT